MRHKRLLIVLSAIIGSAVGFALTFEQFKFSFMQIMDDGCIQKMMFKLILLSFKEALKQWVTLTVIVSAVLFIIWLIFLFIWKLFLSKLAKPCHNKKIVVTGIAVIVMFVVLLVYFSLKAPLSIKASTTERLRALPYAAWAPVKEKDVEKQGVVRYDPQKAYRGINVYCLIDGGGYLMDMNGKIIHTFRPESNYRTTYLLEPYQNNLFLMLFDVEGLIMLDGNSNIIWDRGGWLHHDFAVVDNGDIYTLRYENTYSPRFNLLKAICNNYFVILTKDGKVKKEISFAKMVLKNRVFRNAFNKNKNKYDIHHRPIRKHRRLLDTTLDIFHTNTIEIIDRDIYADGKILFKKGDVLFCIRELDLIGILDVDKQQIIWGWGSDELDRPHHPSLLGNGNILIFDNGKYREYSRVIEVNPATGKIVWEYKGNPSESFYSAERGAAQRLPNGNTLITESNKGRVFEVTRDGEIVWEFYNPEINKEIGRRRIIYRMVRITDLEKWPRLKELMR